MTFCLLFVLVDWLILGASHDTITSLSHVFQRSSGDQSRVSVFLLYNSLFHSVLHHNPVSVWIQLSPGHLQICICYSLIPQTKTIRRILVTACKRSSKWNDFVHDPSVCIRVLYMKHMCSLTIEIVKYWVQAATYLFVFFIANAIGSYFD